MILCDMLTRTDGYAVVVCPSVHEEICLFEDLQNSYILLNRCKN